MCLTFFSNSSVQSPTRKMSAITGQISLFLIPPSPLQVQSTVSGATLPGVPAQSPVMQVPRRAHAHAPTRLLRTVATPVQAMPLKPRPATTIPVQLLRHLLTADWLSGVNGLIATRWVFSTLQYYQACLSCHVHCGINSKCKQDRSHYKATHSKKRKLKRMKK